jgi:hypothetical protein
MSVTVTGGSGAITYQWQQSADGSTGWANSTGTGATTATYTPSSATPGTTYYRVWSMPQIMVCDQAVSNNAVAVIIADLVISTQPSNVNECVGGTNTMSVTVTGGSGQLPTNGNKALTDQPDGRIQLAQELQQQPIRHRAQHLEQPTTGYW